MRPALVARRYLLLRQCIHERRDREAVSVCQCHGVDVHRATGEESA